MCAIPAAAVPHQAASPRPPPESSLDNPETQVTATLGSQLWASRSSQSSTVPSAGSGSDMAARPRSFLTMDQDCIRRWNSEHAFSPIAMMPRLQMSTLGPYSFRVTTSGAIQYGVPTIVVRFACAGSDICAQKPKSAATGSEIDSN